MSNIDEFTGKSLVYSRYRQKYPEAVINYMISKCKLSSTSTIIDVGCGTGILTKQLLDKGINTIGVEPNIDMYNQAKIYLEGYKTSIINSSAEGTNLPDNCTDLVTVAQALHWFELEKFRCEYMRILKNSGRVAILYNNADEYNAAVRDFLDIHRLLCPKYRKFGKEINDKTDMYTAMFGTNNFSIRDYNNDQYLTLEEYIGYAKSLSYSLNPSDIDYNMYIELLQQVFYKYSTSQKLYFPTTTTLVLSKQKRRL